MGAYNVMKSTSARFNGDVWPNYNYVCDAKKLLRPSRELYSIGEIEAKMPLKVLAELTIDRLGMVPNINHEFAKIKETAGPDIIPTMTLHIKNGTDTYVFASIN